jgi:hypothetical protein
MSRLHRARRRIREQLVPAGFGPGHHDHDHTAADHTGTDHTAEGEDR